jgi:hypothetical protein
MSKLMLAGRRTTRAAGRIVYSWAVPGGRWWPVRYPDSITHCKVFDTLANCVNDTCAVLIRSHLREWRRCTTRTKTGLPVGGVDAGNNDADTNLPRSRFGHLTIHKLKTDGSPVRD